MLVIIPFSSVGFVQILSYATRRTIFKLRKGFGSYGFAVISAKRTPYEVIPGSDIDFAK